MMVEILAGIIVVSLGIVAIFVAIAGVIWFIGELGTLIWGVVTAPWRIYQRRQKLLAQRTAAVRRAFIRESHLQNGTVDWSEFYDDESPQAR